MNFCSLFVFLQFPMNIWGIRLRSKQEVKLLCHDGLEQHNGSHDKHWQSWKCRNRHIRKQISKRSLNSYDCNFENCVREGGAHISCSPCILLYNLHPGSSFHSVSDFISDTCIATDAHSVCSATCKNFADALPAFASKYVPQRKWTKLCLLWLLM